MFNVSVIIVVAILFSVVYVLFCYTQKAKIGWKGRLNTEVAGELVSCAIS